MSDSFLIYPDENKSWRFVLQAHIRGESCHGDLRIQISKNLLIGYTLNWIKEVKTSPSSVTDAKSILSKIMPDQWNLLSSKKFVVETKAPEPIDWMSIDNAHFPPGSVGATKFTDGFMIILDQGSVEFGALKSHYREYFFDGKHMPKRFVFRLLPNVWRDKPLEQNELDKLSNLKSSSSYAKVLQLSKHTKQTSSKTGSHIVVWLGFAADKASPYVISKRAVKEKWMPPLGISALPLTVKDSIHPDFHYWSAKSMSEATTIRDNLIANLKLSSKK